MVCVLEYEKWYSITNKVFFSSYTEFSKGIKIYTYIDICLSVCR